MIQPRRAFGSGELVSLIKCGFYHYFNSIDPLYQSTYEALFCSEFSRFMGGGYTDAVNSGTCAAYIALKSLDLPENSLVAISSICDPGVYNSIIIAGLRPVPIPIFNEDLTFTPAEFDRVLGHESTSALIYVHPFGTNSGTNNLIQIRKRYPNLKVIEDISQAIGGTFNNIPLGNFSDIAISSTMGRKALISGASGGLLFTKEKQIYLRVLSYADRGKLISSTGQVIKDAPSNVNLSLNFSADEFGCAIARSSLGRIKKTQSRRLSALNQIADELELLVPKGVCQIIRYPEGSCPFVGVLTIRSSRLLRKRDEFVSLLAARNIPVNPNFNQIAFMWPWLKNYVALPQNEYDRNSEMSLLWSSSHLILYLHERYNRSTCLTIARCISDAVKKVTNL